MTTRFETHINENKGKVQECTAKIKIHSHINILKQRKLTPIFNDTYRKQQGCTDSTHMALVENIMMSDPLYAKD